MTLLGIDLGSTHCKAGLFDTDGRSLVTASRPNPTRHDPRGFAFYDAEEVWGRVWELVQEVVTRQRLKRGEAVQAIGIASMAESGLLVERGSGTARSEMLPWFDPLATAQANTLRADFDLRDRFIASGVRPSFKCSLAKLLWLREKDARLLEGAVWLGAAEYAAFRMCGEMATDPSLAVRTCALRIADRAWDQKWLAELGLEASIFPAILPSGATIGGLRSEWALPGLPAGTPVAVSGHDHICAAFAAEALLSGGEYQEDYSSQQALDSMGTAESLVGSLSERCLGEAEWNSGFSFGCYVAPKRLYWTSGLSTSGGAIEWLRGILGDPALSYAELESLLAEAPDDPGKVLFFPYLAGSGAPHNDPGVRGAFIGLDAIHGRADLYRAVLEGTAYEMEYARQKAGVLTGRAVSRLAAAGGGTRNRRWLQIKADVSGCQVEVLPEMQATALGAGLLAGLGSGVYSKPSEMLSQVNRPAQEYYLPDSARHAAYRERLERFVGFQKMLRD
jgi:sugar (pentulose or hexulose) kinase